MSQHNIAITQLVQVGMAEKVAQETQGHPEVQRQAAQQLTPEMLRQQNAAVPTAEESEGARKAGARQVGERQGGGRGGARRRARQRAKQAEAAAAPEEAAPVPSGWTGNIVDINV